MVKIGRIGIGDQRAELFARGAGSAEHPRIPNQIAPSVAG
jgi:hypothetical protein